MSDLTKEQVLECLAKVRGPDLESDIVSLGLVSDIFIADGKVMFSISVPAEQAEELEPLRQAAEKSVAKLEGVRSAMVALTAERKPGSPTAKPVRPAPSPAQAGAVPPPMQARVQPGGQTDADTAAIPGIPQGRGRKIDHFDQSCPGAADPWPQDWRA